jgi:serine/threonine-protein kinase
MAPEQAMGLPVDRRADIWAIGAILYHYLSGKPPFEGANHIATLHLLMQGKPPAPLPSTIPPAVRAIVERALSHSREMRQVTAAEIQAAIETAMANSNLVTTTADVAAFTDKHLVQRAARRREAIDIALAAAEERERVREILKPEADDSHSGVSTGRIPSPASMPTAASLGLESPILPLPKRSRLALVAAVGAVGVVVGIVATVALRSGGDAHSTDTAAMAGSAAPAMPPAPSPPPPSPSPIASDVAGSSDSPSTSASATISAVSPVRPVTSTRVAPGSPRPTAPTKIPKVIANGF